MSTKNTINMVVVSCDVIKKNNMFVVTLLLYSEHLLGRIPHHHIAKEDQTNRLRVEFV